MEGIVPNLSPPICVNASERRGRLCVISSVERGTSYWHMHTCPRQFQVERGSDIQCVIICANIMFMFVLYFQLLLINMFVFLLCLDTIVCHSIGYTFYDQLLLCSVIV